MNFLHYYEFLQFSSENRIEVFALLTIWEDWPAAIERKKTDERRFSPLGRRIGSFHPLIGLDSRFWANYSRSPSSMALSRP